MTEAQKAYQSDLERVTFGNHNSIDQDLQDATVLWAGKTLDLGSRVTLKLVFDPATFGENVSDLHLRLHYRGLDGEYHSIVVEESSLYNASRGLYAFSYDGFLAAELRTVISAQIYCGENPVSCTLHYSADTYGNNKTGTLLDLCKALFAYSDSAKNFFNP
jgi:hypothetical protein